MMEKTTYTPGPWHSRPVGFRGHMEIFTASDDLIAALHLRDDTAANARLIAAAPELLGELVKITDAYAEAMKDAGVTHYPEALAVVRHARAAIAKARGE